jgi:hypothetical protein
LPELPELSDPDADTEVVVELLDTDNVVDMVVVTGAVERIEDEVVVPELTVIEAEELEDTTVESVPEIPFNPPL